MLLENTAAEFFFLHWKVVHFLLLVTMWRWRWCYYYFSQKWRLFRPPLELIDQGWQCMSCGTWHVVRVALTSNQGREKSLLSSWAEEAVVNPSGDCWSIISYKAALINTRSVSTKPEVGCSVRRWFSSCLNITQHHLKHTAGVVSSLRWECVVLGRCLCSWRELKPHTHPDHKKLARTICFRQFRTKCAPQDAVACKQPRMIYFVKHPFFPLLAGNGKGCRLTFCFSTTTRGLTPDTRPTAQQPTGTVSGLQLNLQAVQHCGTFQLDYLCALFFFWCFFQLQNTQKITFWSPPLSRSWNE